MKYELVIRTEKLQQVKASIEDMMAILDCPARVEVVVRCTTEKERLVRVIQTLLPGEVTVVSFGVDTAKLFNDTKKQLEVGTVVNSSLQEILKKEDVEFVSSRPTPTEEELFKTKTTFSTAGVLPEQGKIPVILKERECPGCGKEFTSESQWVYRCSECSKAGKAQRKSLYTTIINGAEYLFTKEMLIKRMNEGRFQTGTKFAGPSGKHWLIVKEADQFKLTRV